MHSKMEPSESVPGTHKMNCVMTTLPSTVQAHVFQWLFLMKNAIDDTTESIGLW